MFSVTVRYLAIDEREHNCLFTWAYSFPIISQAVYRNRVVYDSATVFSVYTKDCLEECLECMSLSCGDGSLYGVWWESMGIGVQFPEVRERQAQCWESTETMGPREALANQSNPMC